MPCSGFARHRRHTPRRGYERLTLARASGVRPYIDGVPGHVRNVLQTLDQVASTIWGHLRSAHRNDAEVFQVGLQAEATP